MNSNDDIACIHSIETFLSYSCFYLIVFWLLSDLNSHIETVSKYICSPPCRCLSFSCLFHSFSLFPFPLHFFASPYTLRMPVFIAVWISSVVLPHPDHWDHMLSLLPSQHFFVPSPPFFFTNFFSFPSLCLLPSLFSSLPCLPSRWLYTYA